MQESCRGRPKRRIGRIRLPDLPIRVHDRSSWCARATVRASSRRLTLAPPCRLSAILPGSPRWSREERIGNAMCTVELGRDRRSVVHLAECGVAVRRVQATPCTPNRSGGERCDLANRHSGV